MGIRISEMEEATTFGADDYVPIVTNGTNKKALGTKIKDFIAGFFATKTGDNISDKAAFRSAIEISATNTPFDNTGTGMSAENVQAGIVELSGNRALIDGSNIVNPSAFRTNIEASKVSINEYSVTDTTNAQGFIVTGYEFNKYLLSAKVLDNSTNFIRYSLFRASQQDKVVVMCLDDNMNGVANTSVTVTLRYLQID